MIVLIWDKSKSAGPMEYEPGGRGVVRCGNWRIKVSKGVRIIMIVMTRTKRREYELPR